MRFAKTSIPIMVGAVGLGMACGIAGYYCGRLKSDVQQNLVYTEQIDSLLERVASCLTVEAKRQEVAQALQHFSDDYHVSWDGQPFYEMMQRYIGLDPNRSILYSKPGTHGLEGRDARVRGTPYSMTHLPNGRFGWPSRHAPKPALTPCFSVGAEVGWRQT